MHQANAFNLCASYPKIGNEASFCKVPSARFALRMPRVDKAAGTDALKAAVALLLTFAAGDVDVVGYLALYHFFVANMTGNTVHFARQLLQAHWTQAVLAGSVIAAFLIGSGRAIVEVGSRRGIRSVTSFALLIEAGLIALVIVLAPQGNAAPGPAWLLLILAAAMGLQTATLTRVGPLTVHTTFVTGMLNKLAQLLSQGLFLTYDLRKGKQVREARRKALQSAAYIFSIWLVYFVGAVFGAFTESAIGLLSLLIPIALLGSAAILDCLRPLPLWEEQDEP